MLGIIYFTGIRVAKDMAERKEQMLELSEVFIAARRLYLHFAHHVDNV